MSTAVLSFLSEALGPLPAPARDAVMAARSTQAGSAAPVLRAGERWASLYWLESGALRLYYLDRKGQSANKNFFLDGAILWPLTPTLAGTAVDFWIETLAPTRLWPLPWPAWQAAWRASRCATWLRTWASPTWRRRARGQGPRPHRLPAVVQVGNAPKPMPVAVLEAKKEAEHPFKGMQQARGYADSYAST